MAWRRKPRPDVTARKDAVTTGIILARLDSVVDRLEGVYAQVAETLEAAQRHESGEGER